MPIPTPRVRREAIRLIGQLDPQRTLAETVALYNGKGRPAHERHHWLSALASNDTAFRAYLDQNMPAGEDLFL